MRPTEAELVLEHALPTECAAKTQALLDHLASGCLLCAPAIALLRKSTAGGRRVAEAGPPDYAVATVKEAFAIAGVSGQSTRPSSFQSKKISRKLYQVGDCGTLNQQEVLRVDLEDGEEA